MSRRREELTFEMPVRPEPLAFRVDRLLEWDEIQFMRMDAGEFRRVLKARIARELANYIAEKTQLIDLGDDMRGGTRVRVEIAFHDRGTYENWLPQERRAGRSEGVKETLEKLPYGMSPQEFYE